MAANDISKKIDEYFKIENNVFAEISEAIKNPNGIIELIREREEEAIRQAPFSPNRVIFFQGIYTHFLQKWLEYYKMDKNIFVVDNSELAEKPFDVMKKLESFLDLSDFYQDRGYSDYQIYSK